MKYIIQLELGGDLGVGTKSCFGRRLINEIEIWTLKTKSYRLLARYIQKLLAKIWFENKVSNLNCILLRNWYRSINMFSYLKRCQIKYIKLIINDCDFDEWMWVKYLWWIAQIR